MEIPRVNNLSKENFVENYLKPHEPVIVEDVMSDWDMYRFQPESLKKEFGNRLVQVYNDLFDFQHVKTLKDYLEEAFHQLPTRTDCSSYTRWYTKYKEMNFFWSDDVFEALKRSWGNPYFLPVDKFIIPFHNGESMHSHESPFPYKGLFISGRGARTRLHRDPFYSNAILCQFYGQKEIILFDPEQKEFLMRQDGTFIDPNNVPHQFYNQYSQAEYTFKTILNPGEVIFIPSGWFHDVTSITDSVSITWNFVHHYELRSFYNYLKDNPNDPGMETIKYFLRNQLKKDAEIEEIHAFFQKMIEPSL
ncbi:cupin-like domain-containing protein [Yeosuana marina]|uniref:cupin-like domain-containing protein n=1 Tax=Yeosuana marina TaxID=1565536 RepID=UPI0030C88F05